MICRRSRCGVAEALIQWDSCWVDADAVPEGRVMEVLLRRTVRGQNQMLVQWACTWVPIEFCDGDAMAEYNGDVVVEDAKIVAAVDQTLGVDVAKAKTKRARNRKW